MKKFLGILLIMVLSFTICEAQNSSTYDKKLSYNETILSYTGEASDTIGTVDTLWTYTVLKRSDTPVQAYIDIALDSTGGTTDTVWIKLQHKQFSDLDYTTIDSVSWYATVDTVIKFSPSAETFAFTSLGLTDTTGLSGYPADSIVTTGTISVTPTDQSGLSGYFRIVINADTANTLEAKLTRLNFMFLKE